MNIPSDYNEEIRRRIAGSQITTAVIALAVVYLSFKYMRPPMYVVRPYSLVVISHIYMSYHARKFVGDSKRFQSFLRDYAAASMLAVVGIPLLIAWRLGLWALLATLIFVFSAVIALGFAERSWRDGALRDLPYWISLCGIVVTPIATVVSVLRLW